MVVTQGDVASNKPRRRLEKFLEKNSGPFIGVVKKTSDPLLQGTLFVNIEEFSQTKDPAESDLIPCRYLSPFYGVKPHRANSTTDPYDFTKSQSAYGMWFVPPDIDNEVMVVFVGGSRQQAFWIGCVQQPFMNQMIPGIGSKSNTSAQAQGDQDQSNEKLETYGNNTVPAGELNAVAWDLQNKSNNPANLNHPIHPHAEQLRKQGLAGDDIRGYNTSSARRESPSQTFGISTPGAVKVDGSGRVLPLGARKTVAGDDTEEKTQVAVDREIGHSLVMDDGDVQGKNKLVRLRSGGGHQILLNDEAQVVYISNGSGKAWLEFGKEGNIDLFSNDKINIRAKKDMTYHVDGDFKLYARKNIIMKADTGRVVLDGQEITGNAEQNIRLQATKNNITMHSPAGNIYSWAKSGQMHQTGGQFHMVGTEVHMNSAGPIPNFVGTIERTSTLNSASPLTIPTAEVDYPDVNPLQIGPLLVSTEINRFSKPTDPQGVSGMTGLLPVTHEPYQFHNDKIITVSSFGDQPWQDVKAWKAKKNIVNSNEWLENKLRLSDNPNIREAQYESDAQKYVESKVKDLNDIKKVQDTLKEFSDIYDNIYTIPRNLESLKSNVKNELTSRLVENVKGNTVSLLKDQVFVNTKGVLYQAGDVNSLVQGNVKGVVGDLTGSVANSAITDVSTILGEKIGVNVAGTIGTTTGRLNDKITNVNTVTTVYKNIVGGVVTGVTEINSLVSKELGNVYGTVAKSVGKIFTNFKSKFF